MKTELYIKALEKVGNPNVLINIVSRRVKQLTTGGGSMGRPLIADPAGHSATEVALREIVEERFKWELLDEDDELAS